MQGFYLYSDSSDAFSGKEKKRFSYIVRSIFFVNEFLETLKTFEVPAIAAILIVGWVVNGNFTDKINVFSSEIKDEFKELRVELKNLQNSIHDIDKRLYRLEGQSTFCRNQLNFKKELGDLQESPLPP